MPTIKHPTAAELKAFVLGETDEAGSLSLEEHLHTCSACQQLAAATPGDTLVELLRSAQTSLISDAATPPAIMTAETLAVGPVSDSPADVPAALTRHDRYRLLHPLGAGGMGTVWLAEHKLMNRQVALKIIRPELLEKPGAIERFRREAQAAARLDHPNIVIAHDAEQAGDVHFLVMEYVRGTDLQKVLEEHGPLPVAKACEFIRQAALGLQHAHEHGMVHRDIKPQNLMVTPQVKILDFGLASLTAEAAAEGVARQASAISSQKSGLTQADALMGTPDYMAPEQAKDARNADIRADIYSLGCTLYCSLTGTVPFPGGTPIDKVIAHAENNPQPVGGLRKDAPPALLSVLDKMMAKDRDRRYQTPAEVAEALRPFAAASPSKPRRRWRALVAAALLAAAVLLASAVIYVQTDKGEFEISTSDANIAVMISAKGVKIRDQSSNREYLLTSATQDVRTGRYIVVELPDGTEIEGENSFTVKRGGRAIATVRLRADGDHQRIGETDRGLLPGRSDEQNIQGAWKGVAAEVSGQPVPKEFLDAVRPTITFLPGKMVARPNPTVPISKEFLDAAMGKGLVPREAATVLKNGLEGVYHLDPARSPRAIDIAMLGELRRTGLGIYSLDGDTLKLCMSLNPDRVDERPKEFATRPGGLQVMITLKRQSTEPQPAAVAERKAAEYVLSIGGAIRANDQERDLKTVAELPRGPFRLTHVFLTANHQVSDAGLANFTGCRDLTLLYLGKTKVTDAGLAVFKDCWNLADLELADTKVSDAGLVHFRGCKGLRHLDLDGCVNIGDAGLTSFKDCHKLRSLYLFDTHVTNAGLAFLKDCNNLDTVGLGETQIGDAGIAHLHSCKKLKILWVNTTHITDRGLAFLAGCTSLVTLSLGDTLVSDEGLTHIQRCKSLDTLDLTATKITDAGLKRLYPLTNLRDLRLGMTSVTPAGIDELKKALPQCKIRWQP